MGRPIFPRGKNGPAHSFPRRKTDWEKFRPVTLGRGVLQYFYINVGSKHKNEYFWGMKILWIFIRGHYKKIGVGVISIHFRVF